LSLTDVFRVSVISFESRNLLLTLVRTQLAEVLDFAPPDACIMKQKLLRLSRGPEAVARALDHASSWMERRLPELIGRR
jgi:hypothetical protein